MFNKLVIQKIRRCTNCYGNPSGMYTTTFDNGGNATTFYGCKVCQNKGVIFDPVYVKSTGQGLWAVFSTKANIPMFARIAK